VKIVNLARRPFVNRRPVVRFALVVWLLGALLLAVNFRLYYQHWHGSAENRQRLAEIDRELDRAAEELGERRRQASAVNLRVLNARATDLNSLISYRTFPWSALFDDLEEVLPADVRLLSVQPGVKLASPTPGAGAGGNAEAELAPDEVALQLTGVSESEDALLELVDRLYGDPSFRRPFLSSEQRSEEERPRKTVFAFTLSVLYLTRVPELPGEDVEPEVAAGPAEEEGEIPVVRAEDGTREGEDETREGRTAEGEPEVADAGRSEDAAPPPTTRPTAEGRDLDRSAAQDRLEESRAAEAAARRERSGETSSGERSGSRTSESRTSDRLRSLRSRLRGTTTGTSRPSEGQSGGSSGGQSTEGSRPEGGATGGTTPPPAADEPSFRQPDASSTPRLRGAVERAPWEGRRLVPTIPKSVDPKSVEVRVA